MLCDQYNFDILFTSSGCLLQGLSMKSPQVFGEVREGLYLLEATSHQSKFLFNTSLFFIRKESNSSPKSVLVSTSANVKAVSDVKLWHVR